LEVENKQWAEPTWKLLMGVLLPSERRALIGIFALILIGTVLETFSIGIIIPVLSVLSSDEAKSSIPFIGSNEAVSKDQLIQIAVGSMLAIYVVKNVFLAFSTWIQRGFLTRVTSRIGSRMFEVYLRQPYSFHLQKNSSTLIRNTQDASMLIASGIEPMLTILTEGLIVLALLLVLLIVEPVGTLCVVGVLITATIAFQKFFDHKLQRWGTMRQVEKGLIIQTVQQGLGAAKDLRVLGREDWFINEHHKRQKLDSNFLRRINTVQALPRLWLEVMAMTGLAGLVAIMLVTDKDAESIVPVVGLFAATAFRVLPSVNKIVNGRQTLKVSRSTIETIYQDLRLYITDSPEADKSKVDFDLLKIEALNFHYEKVELDVLKNINISINRGEAVGFVGQSGSGKSTLIDIMLGLLEPQNGSVLINGQTIENVKQSWQKQIGYIPQTIFLMDDSLRRNIAIGIADNEIDEVAIVEALNSAQLEDFVASLPEGLDTVVGERGVRLSGGQRQRIGIARALYHRPSVLVLDEATSSLDTETEHGVMQAVQALQGDKTVIIVAHRLSTVEYCDRLYRLDAGRIVDEGTFDEVMNRSQS